MYDSHKIHLSYNFVKHGTKQNIQKIFTVKTTCRKMFAISTHTTKTYIFIHTYTQSHNE